MASESHGQWLKPNGYSGGSNMLNAEHEDLVIDEGTISVSTAYSQNLLNTLNQALESSGVDMSQANLSVNIHLGKRAAKGTTATILSSSKNSEDCEPDPLCNQALESRH